MDNIEEHATQSPVWLGSVRSTYDCLFSFVVCQGQVEAEYHLFVLFDVKFTIWYKVFKCLGRPLQNLQSALGVLNVFMQFGKGKSVAFSLDVIWNVVVCTIQIMRSNIIFYMERLLVITR